MLYDLAGEYTEYPTVQCALMYWERSWNYLSGHRSCFMGKAAWELQWPPNLLGQSFKATWPLQRLGSEGMSTWTNESAWSVAVQMPAAWSVCPGIPVFSISQGPNSLQNPGGDQQGQKYSEREKQRLPGPVYVGDELTRWGSKCFAGGSSSGTPKCSALRFRPQDKYHVSLQAEEQRFGGFCGQQFYKNQVCPRHNFKDFGCRRKSCSASHVFHISYSCCQIFFN